MKKARSAPLTLAIIVVMLLMVTRINSISRVRADNLLPIVQIAPAYYPVENTSQPFSLNLTITNVTDLYGWEFKLYYLNTVVEYINVTQGPFLKHEGQTFWWPMTNNTYNATHGRIHAACSLLGMILGVNGSGTLATVTFQTIGGGNTTLRLIDTKLADSNTPKHNPIPHEAVDGFIDIAEFHNIKVTKVQKTKTIVGQGFVTVINATIENEGNRMEAFNITLYANTTVADKKEVTLDILESKKLTFIWNTANFATGNWTISVYASPVNYETNLEDNNFTDGFILVGKPGDVNYDGYVNVLDLIIVSNALRIYDPNADLNEDGVVNVLDLILVANYLGT